jgi:hypothetical protein
VAKTAFRTWRSVHYRHYLPPEERPLRSPLPHGA